MTFSTFWRVAAGVALVFVVPVWLFMHYGYTLLSPPSRAATASGAQAQASPQVSAGDQRLYDRLESMDQRQQARDKKQDERDARQAIHDAEQDLSLANLGRRMDALSTGVQPQTSSGSRYCCDGDGRVSGGQTIRAH